MSQTEVPPPLGNVVLGGTETEWEATYGKVRYLMPKEVQEVAAALAQLTEDDLRPRLDPAAFRAADIYTYGHNLREEATLAELEPLLDVFAEVRDFFCEAAKQGEVVLLSSD